VIGAKGLNIVGNRYIANPVEVVADKIIEVKHPVGSLITVVVLDNGYDRGLTAGMVARFMPVPGDYLVTEEDGYLYVNPKDVFERKYSKKNEPPYGIRPIVCGDIC